MTITSACTKSATATTSAACCAPVVGAAAGTAGTGGTDAIWFSAGIANETYGLVGTLKAAG